MGWHVWRNQRRAGIHRQASRLGQHVYGVGLRRQRHHLQHRRRQHHPRFGARQAKQRCRRVQPRALVVSPEDLLKLFIMMVFKQI